MAERQRPVEAQLRGRLSEQLAEQRDRVRDGRARRMRVERAALCVRRVV